MKTIYTKPTTLLLLLMILIHWSTTAQSSILFDENFETTEEFPLDGWAIIWSHGAEIENEMLKTSGGIILSPEIDIDWNATDQVRVHFRYMNTVTEENASNVPMTLYLSLWENQSNTGNEPADGHITNYKILNTNSKFKTVMFTLTEADWNYSSLVLSLKFEGGTDGGAISFIDDIQIAAIKAEGPPESNFSSDVRTALTNQAVSFYDLSTEAPTSYTWVFEPFENITFLESTTANSVNPVIEFDNPGSYSVTLFVENIHGENYKVIENFITISCAKYSNDYHNGHISSVSINNNIHPSIRSAYTDFTWLYNEIDLAENSDLTISAAAENWQAFNTQIFWALYIDWDNSGTFSTSPLIEVNPHDTPNVVWNVPIPDDQEEGQIKIRIILAASQQDLESPCGEIAYGEIEDYSLTFIRTVDDDPSTGTPKEMPKEEYIDVYQSNNLVTITLNNDKAEKNTIQIYNISGQLIKTQTTTNQTTILSLPDNSTFYILKVSNAYQTSTFKLLNR